jgi:hypothetical protein
MLWFKIIFSYKCYILLLYLNKTILTKNPANHSLVTHYFAVQKLIFTFFVPNNKHTAQRLKIIIIECNYYQLTTIKIFLRHIG